MDTFSGYNFGNPYNQQQAKEAIRRLIEKAKKGNYYAVRELKMTWGYDWDEGVPDQYKVETKPW